MADPVSPSLPRGAALGPRAIVGLSAGFVVLLLVVAASVSLAQRNHRTLQVAEVTDRARAAITALFATAMDAETGQRGFLLTGREEYLAPYQAAIAALPERRARVQAALANQTAMRPVLDRLEATLADKIAELASTIDSARAGQNAAALELVNSDRGARDMELIRGLIAALLNNQQARLQRELATINRRAQAVVAIDVAGFVLILALAAGIVVGVNRTMTTLHRTERELTAANAGLELARATLEQRVAARTAELTEANVEIQRFAYIVSHDLRSPLVNILGFTGELESATLRLAAHIAARPDSVPADLAEAARDDLPEAIGFIRTSAQKMDRLIGAILRLSREGGRVVTPEPIAMGPMLDGIVATLQHQADSKGAVITVEPLIDLVSDRLMIEQIFSNLIENALKYLGTGRPGAIRVRAQRMGNTALFEVADNGRGIAERDRERVFELFRRAGDQSVPGEGIGLAHVRALLRRLGGKIDCDSTVDVGSTFRVQLPLSPGAAKGVPA